jgi:hypothetical protein
MAIPFKETLRRVNPPTWYGPAITVYNNNYATSSDIITTDYFDDDDFAFGVGEIIWAQLASGAYGVFRFTSATTVEVATD